jgi:hypothetical protein
LLYKKKFWDFFEDAMVKYCQFCFQRKNLSESFKTASIRLIPKKGNTNSISDWRPISLLNCIYKVISKAVNNRLKTISDRILSRVQKGFRQNKYIQECLINVIESIGYCNSNQIPAIVLSIDQSTAFDSVRHDFITKVYEFFGFPPFFIDMLSTITVGRNATIIWDDQS